MKSNTLHRLILIASILIGATVAHASPALAGHPGLAGNNLDGDAAKAVLLGKAVKIGSERVVIIVVKDSDAQEAFLKTVVGMSSGQFQNHWRRLFMTGGGSAPKVVATEAEAVALAAETPGAICIVDTSAAGGLPVLSSS